MTIKKLAQHMFDDRLTHFTQWVHHVNIQVSPSAAYLKNAINWDTNLRLTVGTLSAAFAISCRTNLHRLEPKNSFFVYYSSSSVSSIFLGLEQRDILSERSGLTTRLSAEALKAFLWKLNKLTTALICTLCAFCFLILKLIN